MPRHMCCEMLMPLCLKQVDILKFATAAEIYHSSNNCLLFLSKIGKLIQSIHFAHSKIQDMKEH